MESQSVTKVFGLDINKGHSAMSSIDCPVPVFDLNSQVNALRELYAKYRKEKSFHGYDPSVLKSGIQKYGRRAEVNKGLWCLVELDLFSLLEWDGDALDGYLRKFPEESRRHTQQSAQRIRTNMINRLVAMMTEEVCISAWWMPVVMWDLYQRWHKYRKHPISRKYLIDMYLSLTSQKMIRLVSDIISVYRVPPEYIKAGKNCSIRRIHNKVMSRNPNICANQSVVGKTNWNFTASGYPQNVRSCIKGVIYNLEQGSDNVFCWIRELYEAAQINKVKEYIYTNLLWKILYGFIGRYREWEVIRGPISALHNFYRKMTHKEKPIYLLHAFLLIVRRNEIDWESVPPGVDTPIDDIEKLYNDHVRNVKLKIDRFVMDMHTRGGKRIANRLENFALEGAYVKNENVKFLNPDYRGVYVELKKELDRCRNRSRRVSWKSIT